MGFGELSEEEGNGVRITLFYFMIIFLCMRNYGTKFHNYVSN